MTDFLFHTRRGPDYQFAGAAVCLLRSLGYSARLVSGFYAYPHRYESGTRQVAILKEDVHVWAEVSVGRETWLTVEPTPGFEVLGPQRTWYESVGILLVQLVALLHRNWPVTAAGAFALLLAWLSRHRLADRLHTWVWWIWPRGQRAYVVNTLRLIECRARRAGLSHSSGMTPTRWVKQLVARLDQISGVDQARISLPLNEFEKLAEWACYAPREMLVPNDWVTRRDDHCASAERTLTFTAWRQIAKRVSDEGLTA